MGTVGLKLGIGCKRGVKQGNIQARAAAFGKPSWQSGPKESRGLFYNRGR